MTKNRAGVWVAFLAGLVLAAPAIAVEPPAAALPPGTTSSQSVPEATGPGTSGSGGSSEPLSDKLDRTKGIIHPPRGVDPGMPQTPPREGRTPVIPPPGTGGDRSGVSPK